MNHHFQNSNPPAIHIGAKIREVFDARNMTVSDFAEQLCCERQTIYYIFRSPDITLARLVRICEILQYDFLALYQTDQTKPVTVGLTTLTPDEVEEFRNRYPRADIFKL